MTLQNLIKQVEELVEVRKGGSGSGNFNHAGVPGHLGGSASQGGGFSQGKYSAMNPTQGKALVSKVMEELAVNGLGRTSKLTGGDNLGLAKGYGGGFLVRDTGKGLNFEVVVSGKKIGVGYRTDEERGTREPINPDNGASRIKKVFNKLGFDVKEARATGWSNMWDDDITYTVQTDYGK